MAGASVVVARLDGCRVSMPGQWAADLLARGQSGTVADRACRQKGKPSNVEGIDRCVDYCSQQFRIHMYIDLNRLMRTTEDDYIDYPENMRRRQAWNGQWTMAEVPDFQCEKRDQQAVPRDAKSRPIVDHRAGKARWKPTTPAPSFGTWPEDDREYRRRRIQEDGRTEFSEEPLRRDGDVGVFGACSRTDSGPSLPSSKSRIFLVLLLFSPLRPSNPAVDTTSVHRSFHRIFAPS